MLIDRLRELNVDSFRRPDGSPSRLFLGKSSPELIENEIIPSLSVDQVMAACEPGGWLDCWLSDSWITLVFARWENYYRPSFAELFDVTANSISSEVMGDIRLLRNDVVHHSGLASEGNACRCKVLNAPQSGQRILLGVDEIRVLVQELRVAVV